MNLFHTLTKNNNHAYNSFLFDFAAPLSNPFSYPFSSLQPLLFAPCSDLFIISAPYSDTFPHFFHKRPWKLYGASKKIRIIEKKAPRCLAYYFFKNRPALQDPPPIRFNIHDVNSTSHSDSDLFLRPKQTPDARGDKIND